MATRFYKGPELLIDVRDYDYSLDIWGVGCMMAAFIFKRQVGVGMCWIGLVRWGELDTCVKVTTQIAS